MPKIILLVFIVLVASSVGLVIVTWPKSPDPSDVVVTGPTASAKAIIGPATRTTVGKTGPAKAAATAPHSEFANSRCPIMGQRIDPRRVTPELGSLYKGQKVAFCCEGCKPIWEKLTDAEKQAKLDAAK